MPNVHMAAATLAEAQLNTPDTSERYQSDVGLTDETMQLGALNRIAESNLAIAYEQRTANLIALLKLANTEGWGTSVDAEIARTMVIEALDLAPLMEIVDGIKRAPEHKRKDDQRNVAKFILMNWDDLKVMNRGQAKKRLDEILDLA